jgi:hypothetical protein
MFLIQYLGIDVLKSLSFLRVKSSLESCLTHPRFGRRPMPPCAHTGSSNPMRSISKAALLFAWTDKEQLQSLMTAFHLVLAPSRLRLWRRRV